MGRLPDPDPAGRTKGLKDPERTRVLLLDAGTRLFALAGFDGATADEIAREAGVNKAMINYHFGGKEGLYRAILGDTLSRASDGLRAVRFADLPSDQKLARYVEVFAALHKERPTVSAMLLRELLSGGRFLQRELLSRFLDIFGNIRAIILGGVEDGTFRPVDPLLTHFSILGCMLFFYASAPLRERLVAEGRLPAVVAPSEPQYIAHLTELFARGLRPDRDEARPRGDAS